MPNTNQTIASLAAIFKQDTAASALATTYRYSLIGGKSSDVGAVVRQGTTTMQQYGPTNLSSLDNVATMGSPAADITYDCSSSIFEDQEEELEKE